MPKMTFTGSLKLILDDLAFTMQGLLAKSGGSKIDFDDFGQTGVTIFGNLRVPSSGNEFITGTVDKLRFNETTIDGLVTGRLLLIENMGVKAEQIFNLQVRVPGEGSFGNLKSNAFSNYLGNRNWTLEGSNEMDRVESTPRMSLDGNDKILGKGGSDYLEGGTGGDMIAGGTGLDWLLGEGGSDVLKGGGGKDALEGGNGKDKLFGGGDNDRMLGGSDNDRLFGGKGQDIMKGGDGGDVLNGGKGWDQYFGGGGRDTFIFSGAHGRDWVKDFQNGKDVLIFDRPGKVEVSRNGDDTILTHADGVVILENVKPAALSLDDGIWS